MESIKISAIITENKLAGNAAVITALAPSQVQGEASVTLSAVISREQAIALKLMDPIIITLEFPTITKEEQTDESE
jgi:hypothetical protein